MHNLQFVPYPPEIIHPKHELPIRSLKNQKSRCGTRYGAYCTRKTRKFTHQSLM